jgi:hypothetical protein
MPKTVKLWCEEGEHWWRRPSQRGRPPLNCPKHAPVKEKTEPQTVELWCEAGGHTWDWVKRGFEPINCPQHRTVKQKESQQVELYCEAGDHKWMWTVSRGRRPRRCPEHRTEALPKSSTAAQNGQKKISGLGAIRQRRRNAAFIQMRQRYETRQRDHAKEIVTAAEQRYLEAIEEERAVFKELDRLEMMKLKTPKRLERIRVLREEWERKSRKLNNMYMQLHSASNATRHILA